MTEIEDRIKFLENIQTTILRELTHLEKENKSQRRLINQLFDHCKLTRY